MGDLKWPGRMNWELSSPTKHGIGVWLQYGPVQLTADISWYKSRPFIVCIIPTPNCTTFSLLFHHSVISARSRRTQLLMLFGIALHCRDFGLAYLIGTRRPITELDVELAVFGFSNTLLPFQKLYNRPSLWVWSWPKELEVIFTSLFYTLDMISVIQMERLWFLRSNAIEKCSAVWGSFLGYLDKQAAKPMSNVSHEGWVVHYLCSFLVIDCFAALYFSIAHLLNLDFFVSIYIKK